MCSERSGGSTAGGKARTRKKDAGCSSTVCRARPVLGELWWLMGPKEGPESVGGGRGKNFVASASVQKM